MTTHLELQVPPEQGNGTLLPLAPSLTSHWLQVHLKLQVGCRKNAISCSTLSLNSQIRHLLKLVAVVVSAWPETGHTLGMSGIRVTVGILLMGMECLV